MEGIKIPFSPPDITRAEIDEVADTLKSGWITTGPKTKRFEKEISEYCGTEKAICLNSATAGMELILRLMDIGPGDEVITTPYTYAATSNVILHCGAKPVFVDIKKDDFNINPEAVSKAITSRTKAVMPVDFGGWPCDYESIRQVLIDSKKKFKPKKGTLQERLYCPLVLADAAHSFGSEYNGKKVGSAADFSVFSFHAVKNLTTAEGGAVAFNSSNISEAGNIYRQLQLLSLHGQSKDALDKMKAGSWHYSIELPGYKCNMTDIAASIGLVQLKRFETEMQPARNKVAAIYDKSFCKDDRFIIPPFRGNNKKGNNHLYPLRIKNFNEKSRSELINRLAEKGISSNVHFIPVVMHPYYKKLGYSINNYPNTYRMYENEISLPIYSKMTDNEAEYVVNTIKLILEKI